MTRPSTGGDLAIICVPALLSLWLVPRLGRFSEQFPGIRLHLSGSNDPADIYDPEIDLCIHYGHGSWGDCWSRHWSDLELFRSEEHTYELQSLMRISYAVFCLKKKKQT